MVTFMDIELVTFFLLGAILSSIAFSTILAIKLRANKKCITSLELAQVELQNNFNALCSGSVGIDKRISQLESKTRQQAERQSRLERKEPDLQNYGNAARLANKGADMEELIDHCGLSRGEAELILFLNSQQTQVSH